MTKWTQLPETEKVKRFYSKCSLDKFFEWWSDGEPKWMELRIKNFEFIKSLAIKFKIPFSASGVYVNNSKDLKKVLNHTRDIHNVWMGINPRKPAYNDWGRLCFGGRSDNVEEIKFIFIDIDGVEDGVSGNDVLEEADILANRVLESFSKAEWNKSYVKICSGHGVQLLIKLDYPIRVPCRTYDTSKKLYLFDEEYEKMLGILRTGIGKQILSFNAKRKETKVLIDKSGFKIAGVCALHCSKNFKHGIERWRGIVELKDGLNSGLVDYVIECSKPDIFIKDIIGNKKAGHKDRIIKGKIRNHILVKFMLENELPVTGRNNKLFFQLKCLLRDSKIDLTSSEWINIHKELERKHHAFPMNIPDKKYTFSKDIVNSYCIDHLIPPLYELWNNRKKYNKLVDVPDYKEIKYSRSWIEGKFELDKSTNLIEDMRKCKEHMGDNLIINKWKMYAFLDSVEDKYGKDTAKYCCDYLIEKFINFS